MKYTITIRQIINSVIYLITVVRRRGVQGRPWNTRIKIFECCTNFYQKTQCALRDTSHTKWIACVLTK